MAGVKGRSGRGGWDKAIAMKKLWDLSIPILKHALVSKETSESKKVEIALALVSKMMPQKVENEHSGKVTVMGSIEIDSKLLEVKIGD